jgi:hypothetical protein
MKKSEVTKLLAVTWLICVCILYTSLSHAGIITDNFAGASINTKLWTPFNADQNQRVFQQDGELRIQIDGASTGDDFGAGLNSRFRLKGDFVMTVGYRLITWPDANGVRLGFEGASSGPDSDDGVMLKRRNEGANQPQKPENNYSVDFDTISGWYGNILSTTDNQGSLKLTRVGSVLTGYFASQPNVWQLIGSHDYSAPGLPEWVGMTLWANSRMTVHLPDGTLVNLFGGQNVEIAFDNFQVTYDQIRYTSVPGPSLLLLLLD